MNYSQELAFRHFTLYVTPMQGFAQVMLLKIYLIIALACPLSLKLCWHNRTFIPRTNYSKNYLIIPEVFLTLSSIHYSTLKYKWICKCSTKIEIIFLISTYAYIAAYI